MAGQTVTGGVDPRKVFVIHGRNEPARKGLFEFLRTLGLDPIEWSEAIRLTGKGSPYLGEVLDAVFAHAQAVVILQTPDDVARLHESLTLPGDPECVPRLQPRPNVLFEAGMAMGRDEERTVIVELGEVRGFSDIQGRHVVRLDDSVKRRQELAIRLQTAGCAVRLSGTDWHDAGDLTPPVPSLADPVPGAGEEVADSPRLEARYVDHGPGRSGVVQITNHGPGDLYDLEVTAAERGGGVVQDADGFSVPRLPAGKTVRVLRRRPAGVGAGGRCDITVIGRTADGTPVRVGEFADCG
ncbi:TIR domain-containing protein [Streptomyces sp. SAJ15]|uniref:TIR domain-containing protein n=1 Tax=Streptomyces sp. SAJ15 TaxID=2011095 RepID=UPI001185C6C1|nr:nucleotide-binding protein [Streptomyces sp. SAJ15]TVL91560.1 nucleotide-binding protein [Streptomyces sp. SAJ15]